MAMGADRKKVEAGNLPILSAAAAGTLLT